MQVESIETRLKEDILSEVRETGGRVIGYWENIQPDNVKTPAEVYAALKNENYNISYRRIPLTRERDALASDVDAIQYCKDDSAGSYLFVSHTGFGGVSYAMAITCLLLQPGQNFTAAPNTDSSTLEEDDSPSRACDEEALSMGDYRDILSLIRVLSHGPQSKSDVDGIIELCAGAGHLREDIVYYTKELNTLPNTNEENRSYIMDMGVKALRRYFYLITFRSYLYCTSPEEMKFLDWMRSRPELGYLCHNLRIDK